MRLFFIYESGYLTPVCQFSLEQWAKVLRIERDAENLLGWCYYDNKRRTIKVSSALGIEHLNVNTMCRFLDILVKRRIIEASLARESLQQFRHQHTLLSFIGKNPELYSDSIKIKSPKMLEEEVKFLNQVAKRHYLNTWIIKAVREWRTLFQQMINAKYQDLSHEEMNYSNHRI